jgi:hypothetical protein
LRANRLDGAIEQPSASPRLIEYRTAWPFTTGSEPGRPRHTGVMSVFGSATWNSELAGFGAAENIFVLVLSSTCTSSPMTGSKSWRALSKSISSARAIRVRLPRSR